jgi:hypothetical protein
MNIYWVFFLCVCVWYWGLNLGPTPWATLPALFVLGIFEIGSQGLICLGCLQSVIPLISASWVARIIGVSHWHLAYCLIYARTVCYLQFTFNILPNVHNYSMNEVPLLFQFYSWQIRGLKDWVSSFPLLPS